MSPEVMGRALLPLRAFLGFTFCFAGLQKLANPDFIQASNPVSIQAQLAGAVRRSPVHSLISPVTHLAVPIGLLIAVGEVAIGIGTLLGLWQRLAAVAGMAVSMMLFLTVSFHSSPYYTGSDIVFLFAWTPLLLAGAGPLLSADAMIAARTRERQDEVSAEDASRREIMLKGAVTAVTAVAGVVLSGAAAGLGRLAGGTKNSSGNAAGASLPQSASELKAGSGASGGARAIGTAKDVPIGGAVSFKDPHTGDPSIVIQATAGKFVAFDAVCPHAGCAVGYDRARALIVCPCHGSQFNAATGAVEVGPAPTGLTPIPIAEHGNGQLYAI